MAEVELTIAGRPYLVACRNGEEENLRAAGVLVDAKSREAISGLVPVRIEQCVRGLACDQSSRTRKSNCKSLIRRWSR